MRLANRNKRKLSKVIKGLSKASRTHAKQAKTLKTLINKRGKKIIRYSNSILSF